MLLEELQKARTSMNSTQRAERSAAIALLVAGTLLWIPLVQLLLGRDDGFLSDLGFRSGPTGTALGWGAGILVALTYVAYTVRNNPLVREHWLRINVFKIMGILAAIGAAVVEEAFFRRVVMDWVLGGGGSALLQVLASGSIFGLAHAIWGAATRQWVVGAKVVLATGSLGLALGAVYLLSERSLAPVIVSHFLITASIQPGIMIAAFSGAMGKRPAVR